MKAHTTQNSLRPLLMEEEPLDRSLRMNTKRRRGTFVVLLVLAMPLFALAQDDVQPPAGSVRDGYIVQQSIEFGGRITGVSGNEQMYDTLVNLRGGPRLLGQELSMRPIKRGRGPFDTLYLSSFGFGGDPNDMARLRIEKGKWYNFVALYRRDENFFDDNVFANPLNLNQGIGAALQVPVNPAFPATSSTPWLFDPTSMPWYANSPHLQDTVRNMGDFDLTLFPQSAVRIRLGYARNDNQGRIDTTLEGPLRSIISEYSHVRSDRYQFGIDIRVLKRTTISIDQFFEHDKVDPNFFDNNPSFTDTVTGTPIDIGLLLPPASPPNCSIVGAFPGGNVVNPTLIVAAPTKTCNIGLFSFQRSGSVRTDIPTAQLSLQSNYFRRLDITASGTYSSGHSEFLNYREFVNLLRVPGVSPSLLTSRANTDRVSGNADLGLTYHITKGWSVSDKFRWLDWRNPGTSNQAGFDCTSAAAPGLTLGGAGCTIPSAGNTNLYQTYIAERTYSNTAKLNWAPSRLFSAYLGYHYGRRELKGAPNTAANGDTLKLNSYYQVLNFVPVNPEATTKINEHTALGGIVLRPTDAWRVNADLELLSADNAFTNIGPRHQQRVRLNTTYKVNRWSSINGGVHFVETRNDFAENYNAAISSTNPNLFPTAGIVPKAYGHKDHWRYYTLGASLNPNRQFGLDFGWTYLDQLINSDTCVPVGAGTIVQFLPPATPLVPCNGFKAGGVPLIQDYQERTNSGYAILTFRPIHRVTLNAGYEITSTAGHNRWLLPGGSDGTGNISMLSDIYGNSPPLPGNPISPSAFPGPFPDAPLSQALNWHKPSAGIAVDVTRNFTFKANYAYYDYNEKETRGLPVVTLPRDFHAHTGTISLKYLF